MKLWRVDDVMTKDVVAVTEDTPYREIVDLLVSRRMSAVPVVDRFGAVVGVVSEADLLHKIEANGAPHPRIIDSWRHRGDRAKAGGRTAGDVMTAPAVTALPSLAVAAAARRMDAEHVKRLPVVTDTGRLVGIVTRGDLLKMHLRSDAEVRRDVVREVLTRTLVLDENAVSVDSHDGVVTLRGRLDRKSSADIAVRLSRQIPGVVNVVDELTFDFDDSSLIGIRAGLPFGVA